MFYILKASLFKLFRDRTFQVTAIIGVVLAGFMALIGVLSKTLTGEGTFLSSFSLANGFGLTVPINLIVFTVGEFTYGTVRNKIIAGFSKRKIYAGLFLTGLVFTFLLVTVYVGVSLIIATSIGGFDGSKIGGASFILTYIAFAIVTYAFTTALSVFVATLIRNIGGSISIVIILLVMISLSPLFVFMSDPENMAKVGLEHWSSWVNPVQMIGFYTNDVIRIIAKFAPGVNFYSLSPTMIISGLVTPLYWATILYVIGSLSFEYSDVK